jgi:hypothetical protein
VAKGLLIDGQSVIFFIPVMQILRYQRALPKSLAQRNLVQLNGTIPAKAEAA